MSVKTADRGGLRVHAVRDWDVWALPPLLRAYIAGIGLVWGMFTAWAVIVTPVRAGDVATYGVLLVCGAVAVEAQRRQGELAGMSKDMLSAWWLPIAFVLPPVYSLLAPIPMMALYQWRVRWSLPHRRVFSVFAIGLTHAGAAVTFLALREAWGRPDVVRGPQVLEWAGIALLCALGAGLLGAALVAVAIKVVAPEETFRSLLWNRDNLVIDVGELCTGVMLAVLAALNPALVLVAVVPVVLLQRALMHDQLTAAARTDPKTGLLNAVAWEREASTEISRATRTGSALAVMLIDLDHFKFVNDRFGHLAGDDVLVKVAEVMREQTRDYDSCARFGGDEFAVLLPNSDLVEARRTATRILRHVDEIRVVVGSDTIQTSVSIGVAELSHRGEGVTDLLAAADLALYRAKSAGRHQLG